MREETIGSRTVFAGRLLRLEVLDVELEDGSRSVREVVRHPGAAAVLAAAGEDRYLFVRQYRKPVDQVMLEVVAGTIEPGEDPERCARREVEEETGHTVDRIERIGTIYPSPGYVDEVIEVYRARVSEWAGSRPGDDDERIEVVELTREEILRMIRNGGITDAKTLAVWSLHVALPAAAATEERRP